MVIHEFENVSITRSNGGDYYVEAGDHGEFLYLSPNGSDEHNKMEEWIADLCRVEEDFFDNEFLLGVSEDVDIEKEWWMCSECGNSMIAIDFADNWWCQDDELGNDWFKLNDRPDWSENTCPECPEAEQAVFGKEEWLR